ncbi:glycosyl transferase [Mangrovactinospora gilvigrisea]|uniref:Glycosyl transferase n=1 Tax=Mangrovactinospora gilvigrisea TaxID=1428644 RepID=A0A1J7BYZ6_9ACTN|nr:glycosyltransferase [Mangrovactinospora gilvigrisea]OIV38705.1 glycosyl transferase [Mangrovactinospora gilvigrisea]
MPRIKVSVIVPVYNTGVYIDTCAPSLLGQSLSADEYEVIYVDDGSNDDTPARLEKLAAVHPQVRVHTRPNSGWPGAPRNLGMQVARGEYLQFVDHDDLLGREALERLYAHATRNASDVVVGKMSSTMVRPRRLFRHTVDTCTIDHDELMQSLTPHKMFRRAFVQEHGLQFPEGPWFFEDMFFVVSAYLKAQRISVLADYPCYYWMKRDDGGNNTRHRFDPRYGFWPNVRTIVRQITDGTLASGDPDALQNRLLHRMYHVEILSRAREPEILREEPSVQRPRFQAARKLALEFPPAVCEGLPAVTRLRADLLQRGDYDGARALAERVSRLRADAVIGRPGWEDGCLTAEVTVRLLHDDGAPLELRQRDGAWWLDPALLAGVPGTKEGWPVRDPFRLAYAEVVIKDRDRGDWWYPEGDLQPQLQPLSAGRWQLAATGRMRLDPRRLAGGRPLRRGVHDVWAYLQLLGVDRMARMGGTATPGSPAAGAALIDGHLALPYWTAGGQLALDIDQRQRRLGPDTLPAAAANTARGRRSLPLPHIAAAGTAAAGIGVVVASTPLKAELLAQGQVAHLRLPADLGLPTGRHAVTLPPCDAPIAFAVVRDGALLRLEGPECRAGIGRRLADDLAHRASRRTRSGGKR